MALNVSRFAGNSKIRAVGQFLGIEGRVWLGGNNTTETAPVQGASKDIRKRLAAGEPALVERNEP